MRVLAVADTHIGSSYEHRRDALADQDAVLAQVANLAVERQVSLVLHGGDVFHRTKPAPEELHCFKRFADELAQAGIPMVALHGNGNHEAAFGQKSALELFAGPLLHVSRRPEIVEFPGVSVCTLPAVPMVQLVAQDTTDRAEIHEQAVDLLLQSARDLYAEASADRPKVLLGHWAVSGASLPTGLPVDQLHEPVLPLWALEEMGWDAVAMGHIHVAALLNQPPRSIISCGSPMVMDFGEAEVEHGVWIIEMGDIGGCDAEFVPLQDRRFITVTTDLTAEEAMLELVDGMADETDLIAAAIAEAFPLTDAVVRVRYRASEEQHRRVDQAALLRLLDDAGVHRVFGGLQWVPVCETRVRVAGVYEDVMMQASACW